MVARLPVGGRAFKTVEDNLSSDLISGLFISEVPRSGPLSGTCALDTSIMVANALRLVVIAKRCFPIASVSKRKEARRTSFAPAESAANRDTIANWMART